MCASLQSGVESGRSWNPLLYAVVRLSVVKAVSRPDTNANHKRCRFTAYHSIPILRFLRFGRCSRAVSMRALSSTTKMKFRLKESQTLKHTLAHIRPYNLLGTRRSWPGDGIASNSCDCPRSRMPGSTEITRAYRPLGDTPLQQYFCDPISPEVTNAIKSCR